MKKIIALMMVLVMMMSVAIPAFAADLSTKPNEAGDVIIKTDTKDADGNDAEKYTVTIPADTTIPWRQEVTAADYSITSQLRRNNRVEVSVAGSGAMKTADGAYSIDYSLVGDTSYKTTQPTIVEPDVRSLDVVITMAEWENAVVEEYADIITYTAGIVAA